MRTAVDLVVILDSSEPGFTCRSGSDTELVQVFFMFLVANKGKLPIRWPIRHTGIQIAGFVSKHRIVSYGNSCSPVILRAQKEKQLSPI